MDQALGEGEGSLLGGSQSLEQDPQQMGHGIKPARVQRTSG